MTTAVRPAYGYTSVLSTTIAASPAWTPITTAALFPICILSVQATGSAVFEISVDGINPIALINDSTPLQINFRSNRLLQPAGTIVYARLVSGAPAGTDHFAVSVIEESIQNQGG